METIKEIDSEQFHDEVLDYQGKMLVDFYGADCVVCEAVARWFEQMSDVLPIPVRKVFLSDPRSPLAQRYQLRGIPTVILFDNGVEQARMAGEFSLERFRDFVLQSDA